GSPCEPAGFFHAVDGAGERGAIDGGELRQVRHRGVRAGVESGEQAPFRDAQTVIAQTLRQLAVARADYLREPEEDMALEAEGCRVFHVRDSTPTYLRLQLFARATRNAAASACAPLRRAAAPSRRRGCRACARACPCRGWRRSRPGARRSTSGKTAPSS